MSDDRRTMWGLIAAGVGAATLAVAIMAPKFGPPLPPSYGPSATPYAAPSEAPPETPPSTTDNSEEIKRLQDQLAAERAERERVAKPDAVRPAAAVRAYDLSRLDPSVRAAVQDARTAERTATAAAARARAGQAGASVYDYGPDGPTYVGYHYEGEWSAGNRNGYGYFIARPPSSFAGYQYSGHWAKGTYDGPGVARWSDGTKYEGGMAGGKHDGYGVMWTAEGRVSQAGIWSNGSLTTPLGPQGQ